MNIYWNPQKRITRYFLLMLFACAVFTAVPAFAATKTVRESSNGKTVKLMAGDVLEVRLKSNPTTGYSWIVQQDGAPQLEPKVNSMDKRQAQDAPRVGAAGVQVLTFFAVHRGTAELKLSYQRPWEKGVTAASGFHIKVVVK